MSKKRFDVEIADVQLAILSDERDDFVNSIVEKLDERIRDLTVRNKRCSKLDASLLCAIDYCSEKMKADKRIRNLEAQISLYDANLRRMRDEIARLNKQLGIETVAPTFKNDEKENSDSEHDCTEETSQVETAGNENSSEVKISDEDKTDNDIRDVKIRQIEDLLRKRKSSGEE